MNSFEKVYAHYEKQFERRGRFQNLNCEAAPLCKPWLPQNKSAKILDFACGIGETLSSLNVAGYKNLTGIDATRSQIETAKKILPEDVELHLADGMEFLKTNLNQYDMIIAYDIVEHFTKEEAIELCQDFFSSLRPGGTLVVKIPNSGALVGLFGRDIDFTHLSGYTEFSLFQLFDTTGFINHQLVEKNTSRNMRIWRPWKPFTGFGFRPKLNILLHKMLYWLAGTIPPSCFEINLEAWTRKPKVVDDILT